MPASEGVTVLTCPCDWVGSVPRTGLSVKQFTTTCCDLEINIEQFATIPYVSEH